MPVFLLPDRETRFPPPHLATREGILAVGGDLRPERLLEAYRRGIFPWYDARSPILWWSPDPRCVLFPSDLHVPRSLDRLIKKGLFHFTVDRSFEDVLCGCARTPRPGQHGTWLVPEMHAAYLRLHKLGIAHSVEAWQDGALAGGFYGLSLGTAVFGESMFFTAPNASKAAFAWFARRMAERDCRVIDCQQTTAHMLRFGASEIPREKFLRLLEAAVKESGVEWG